MVISIKNMVCPRCISAVENAFAEAGLPEVVVTLGKAEIAGEVPHDQLLVLKGLLEKAGFEVLDNRDAVDLERVRNIIIEMLYDNDNELTENLSTVIASRLHRDYGSISQLFSQTNGITIEQFYILQKIERVKELLSYGQENLNEIADRLRYSSPSHLSRQFRSITGMTPREFRKNQGQRTFIDKI